MTRNYFATCWRAVLELGASPRLAVAERIEPAHVASASVVCSLLAVGFLVADPWRMCVSSRAVQRNAGHGKVDYKESDLFSSPWRMLMAAWRGLKPRAQPLSVRFEGVQCCSIPSLEDIDDKAVCWWQTEELATFLSNFAEAGTDIDVPDDEAPSPSSLSPGGTRRKSEPSSPSPRSKSKGLATPSTVQTSSNMARVLARDAYIRAVLEEQCRQHSAMSSSDEAWIAIANAAQCESAENSLLAIARANKMQSRHHCGAC
mmetsp:Transcript_6688/g.11713  ORF Transcript_6688/g.11713 Transcript_6688/m.11713 type:complete len:259 (-) Transcript_6688:130-906(-)